MACEQKYLIDYKRRESVPQSQRRTSEAGIPEFQLIEVSELETAKYFMPTVLKYRRKVKCNQGPSKTLKTHFIVALLKQILL